MEMIRWARHFSGAVMGGVHGTWRQRLVHWWLGRGTRTPQRWLRYAWVLLFITAGVCWSYRYTEQLGIENIRGAAIHHVDLYDTALKSELARYIYLPSLLNLNREIVQLLQARGDAALVNRVDRYLAAVNRGAHSDTLYIMGLEGTALASSNWNEPDSFVGRNYGYRPYFQEALASGSGSFYGLGAASKKAGYFYAERIYDSGKIIGIAAVKINLDKIEETWRQAGDTAMISDANGIIFLSTCDRWRFRALSALSREARAAIIALHQYDAPGALQPIGLIRQASEGEQTNIAKFAPDADLCPRAPAFLKSKFLLLSRAVPGTHWTISVMSNISSAEVAAVNVAVGVGLGMALIGVFALYLLQRRRIIAQELAVKKNLHRMNEELERTVARRTEALSKINKALKVEVAERRHAETVLKSTLQELVQAAKLVALGQMSASITHELNQPLAALRTLSANALTFMQRSEFNQVHENLQVICGLSERMGKITTQLKRFARKSPTYLDRVQVSSAISNSLFLLDARIRSANIELVREEPQDEVFVIAEPNRLEQVLINLIANAIDAMTEVDNAVHVRAHVLTISVSCEAEHVLINVRDTGVGIPEEVRRHLFEPFFTTKDQGHGLGLGLTISVSIIQEFGGTLDADIRGDGTVFTVKLKQATPRENDAQ